MKGGALVSTQINVNISLEYATEKPSKSSLSRERNEKSESITNAKRVNSKVREKETDRLRCFYTNATSLVNKIDELKVLIHQKKRPHILLITETWFNEKSLTSIAGYNAYLRNREQTIGGGVAIYVRTDIKNVEV
jgi:hypothetical protein